MLWKFKNTVKPHTQDTLPSRLLRTPVPSGNPGRVPYLRLCYSSRLGKAWPPVPCSWGKGFSCLASSLPQLAHCLYEPAGAAVTNITGQAAHTRDIRFLAAREAGSPRSRRWQVWLLLRPLPSSLRNVHASLCLCAFPRFRFV